jgi:hypothetical protein
VPRPKAGLTWLHIGGSNIGAEEARALAEAFSAGSCPRAGLSVYDLEIGDMWKFLSNGNDVPPAAARAVEAALAAAPARHGGHAEQRTTVAALQRLALARTVFGTGPIEGREGKVRWVDPDFGSTLTIYNRGSQSNCWVNNTRKLWTSPMNFRFSGGRPGPFRAGRGRALPVPASWHRRPWWLGVGWRGRGKRRARPTRPRGDSNVVKSSNDQRAAEG